MKIAFFSDIHGNIYSFKEFLKYISKEQVDLCIFCGDIFGYYYYQNEIIEIIKKSPNIISILGNHDKMFLDIIDNKLDENILVKKYGKSYCNIGEKISDTNVEYIRQLPLELNLEFDNIKIGVFHGSPLDKLNGRIYPDTDIIEDEIYKNYNYVILGHTHHKIIKTLGKTTIINPGSLGQQRDGKGCSFLILDTLTNLFQFKEVNYNIEELVKDIHYYDNGNQRLIEVLYRKR